MLYTFPPLPAINPEDSTLVPGGAEGLIYAPTDTSFSTPLSLVDLTGVPMASVKVTAAGLTQAFRVDGYPEVVWKSGSYVVPLIATRSLVDEAVAARQAAEQAASTQGSIQAVTVLTGDEARPLGTSVVWLSPSDTYPQSAIDNDIWINSKGFQVIGIDVGAGFDIRPAAGNQTAFDADLAAMIATGSAWVRYGISSWDAGGIFGGDYYPNAANMSFFSDAFEALRDAGFKISLTLAEAMVNAEWSEQEFRDYNRLYWQSIASTIGPFVDVVQVFNEHDTIDYHDNSSTPTLDATYLSGLAAAIEVAAEEFHAVKPELRVTTSVMGYPVDDTTQARWETFYDGGIADVVDVLGFNVYPETGASTIASLTTRLNAMQEKYGKRAIVTEIGLPVTDSGYTTADAEQAIPAMVNAAAAAKPVAVLVYGLRNTGTDTDDGEQMFGVLNNDGSQRAHYDTVVAAVQAV